METLGIVGYGHFGAALADLAEESGLGVAAWDPHVEVVPGRSRTSLAAVAASADVIVLAVPIDAIERAIAALRPHLTTDNVVVDVSSVKVRPSTALATQLGEDVPWVATHPLFGPVSLALGERPLRVVVCPNPIHTGAVDRVERLFVALGCTVLRQSADAHDRAMAETHALAFYVAKAMHALDVDIDSEVAPPSFQAMARTVRTVRGDAGHLFALLHTANPFAAEVRDRFLHALQRIDRNLRDLGEDGERAPDGESAEPLALPDLGARSPALRATRELIDDLDRELVSLLARRARLADRARHAKATLGAQVLDPGREASLMRARRTWADAEGLDPDDIGAVFESILRFSRNRQRTPDAS